jgi:hypothetical protein
VLGATDSPGWTVKATPRRAETEQDGSFPGGASERSIAATTGNKSMTLLRRYIRPAGLFVDNVAAAVGL